ncbi:MAG: thiol protease/hemagglutinin PrtT [Bacteroidales bacterium]|nr:thiol protease/hemagglutinin PrtT [Bacteroidales bacterium]
MKKILSILCFVWMMLLGLVALNAAPVDTSMARSVAMHFFGLRDQTRGNQRLSAELRHVETRHGEANAYPLAVFYVYDFHPGFVIVSADDRMEPVLGYSLEGDYDAANVPDNMRAFLEGYAEELQYAVQTNYTRDARMSQKWHAMAQGTYHPASRNQSVVGPLLSTRWDQNSPYNALCPAVSGGPGGHAYAGCVATMMGQIMRYWEYPSRGIGSNTYVNSDTLCPDTMYANFGTALYDYSLMPEKLTSASSTAEKNAVTTLLLHCGVAVNMLYGADGSSASTSYASTVMQQYFRYPASQYLSRNNYSSTWVQMLKQELDQLRPIPYRGSGSGGHAFVCDGYDDMDYFHFNWGWSGSYNGYYLLSSLLPGTHDFTSSHGAIFGLYANKEMLNESRHHLSFLTEAGTVSEAQSLRIRTANVSHPLQLQAMGNFQVSLDSVNFQNVITMSSTGGVLYVRFLSSGTQQVEYGTIRVMADSALDVLSLTGMSYVQTCNPPQNMTATYQRPMVDLQWDAPQANTSTAHTTISWDSTSSTTYRYSPNYTVTMLHRYCDTDLVAMHGQWLTGISFYAKNGINECYVVAYQGGSYENGSFRPGQMVMNQQVPLSALTHNQWCTVALNTPVLVDASQELWVGYKISVDSGYYAMPTGATSRYVPDKGDIVGRHYASGSLTWKLFGSSRNFLIKAHLTEIPSSVNYYKVLFDNNLITLLPDTATTYSSVVVTPGPHQYTVTAVYGNQCEASISDTITVPDVITTYDYQQDSVCANQLPYTWYGLALEGAGVYSDTLYSAYYDTMCIRQLTLTVLPTYHTESEVVELSEYMWNGDLLTASGDYTHTYMATNGCDSVVVLHLTLTVGVNPISDPLVCQVYPNPTEGQFTINNDQLIINSVQVYDVYGKLLKTIEANANIVKIDVRELSAGMYFARVITEKGVVTRCFVKK